MKSSNKKIKTNVLIGVALLSAISFILQFLDFQFVFSPPFIKFDFSEIPALLGGFAYGPIFGILIELIKNLLQLTSTKTGGIGELANFIINSSFVFSACLYYYKNKTKKNAIIGLIIGSIICGIVAAFVNYIILLPMYSTLFMPMDTILKAFNTIFPFIHTKLEACLFNILPMNILKCGVISFITFLFYKRISPILHK